MFFWLTPYFVAVALGVGFMAWIWSRSPPKMERVLFTFVALTMVYALGDAVTAAARTMFWEVIGIDLLYAGGLGLACVTPIIVLRYAELIGRPFRWSTRSIINLTRSFGTAGWLAVATNPWHGQYLEPVIGGRNLYRWMWWMFSGGGYLLIGAGVILAGRLASGAVSRAERASAIIIALAASSATLSHFLYVLPAQAPPFDPVIGGLMAATCLFLYATHRHGMIPVSPVALSVVVETDADPILITRRGIRISYANAAARDLLAPIPTYTDADLAACLMQVLEVEPAPPGSDATVSLRSLIRAASEEGVELRVRQMESGKYYRVSRQTLPSRRSGVTMVRLRDVTTEERNRRYEARLRRQQRWQGLAAMSAGVAHDFNNLLAAILTNVELAKLGQVPPEARCPLDNIRAAVDEGAHLVRQMLLSSANVMFHARDLDLSVAVREYRDALSGPVSGGIAVEYDLVDDLPRARVDRSLFRQAVEHLVDNAREALEKGGGRIHVSTGHRVLGQADLESDPYEMDPKPGPYVFVRAADEGRGTEQAQTAKLFEPFYTTKELGRGLGLSVVRGVMRLHRGTITVATGDGGTTVTLYFPAGGAPISLSGACC